MRSGHPMARRRTKIAQIVNSPADVGVQTPQRAGVRHQTTPNSTAGEDELVGTVPTSAPAPDSVVEVPYDAIPSAKRPCNQDRGAAASDTPQVIVNNFDWVKGNNWQAWESVLYALVWLRMVVIEENVEFSEDLWKKRFPEIDAKRQSHMLECVVLLMRQPLKLRPTWSTDLLSIIPAFPPHTKLTFSARALADYLRRVSRKNSPGWQKYSMDGQNPRVLYSRNKDWGWWRLVSDPTSRDHLLNQLRHFMGVQEGDKDFKSQLDALNPAKNPVGRPKRAQITPVDEAAESKLNQLNMQIAALKKERKKMETALSSALSRADVKLFKTQVQGKLDVASSASNYTDADYALGLVTTPDMTKDEHVHAAVNHARRATRLTREFILELWAGDLNSVLVTINKCFLPDAARVTHRNTHDTPEEKSIKAFFAICSLVKLGDQHFVDAAYYNAMIKASVNSPRVAIVMDAFTGSSISPRLLRSFEGHLQSAQQKNLWLLLSRDREGILKLIKLMIVFDNFNQGQRFTAQSLKKTEGANAKNNLNSALSHYVFIPRAYEDYMGIDHTPVPFSELKPSHFSLQLPSEVNFAMPREQLNKKADAVYVPELTVATQSENPNKCIPVFNEFEGSILHELNERNLYTSHKMMHKFRDQVDVDIEKMESAEANKFKFESFSKPDCTYIHRRVCPEADWKATPYRSLPIQKLNTMEGADINEYCKYMKELLHLDSMDQIVTFGDQLCWIRLFKARLKQPAHGSEMFPGIALFHIIWAVLGKCLVRPYWSGGFYYLMVIVLKRKRVEVNCKNFDATDEAAFHLMNAVWLSLLRAFQRSDHHQQLAADCDEDEFEAAFQHWLDLGRKTDKVFKYCTGMEWSRM